MALSDDAKEREAQRVAYQAWVRAGARCPHADAMVAALARVAELEAELAERRAADVDVRRLARELGARRERDDDVRELARWPYVEQPTPQSIIARRIFESKWLWRE